MGQKLMQGHQGKLLPHCCAPWAIHASPATERKLDLVFPCPFPTGLQPPKPVQHGTTPPLLRQLARAERFLCSGPQHPEPSTSRPWAAAGSLNDQHGPKAGSIPTQGKAIPAWDIYSPKLCPAEMRDAPSAPAGLSPPVSSSGLWPFLVISQWGFHAFCWPLQRPFAPTLGKFGFVFSPGGLRY